MFEITQLKEKKLSELHEIAKELKISRYSSLKKLDLIYQILDVQATNPTQKKTEEKNNQSKRESNPNQKNSVEKINSKIEKSQDDKPSGKDGNPSGKENHHKHNSNNRNSPKNNPQKKSIMVIKTTETDTKNLILNLMQL